MIKILKVVCVLDVISETLTNKKYENNFTDLTRVETLDDFISDMLNEFDLFGEKGNQTFSEERVFQQCSIKRKTFTAVDSNFLKLEPQIQFEEHNNQFLVIEFDVLDEQGSFTVIEKFFVLE